LKAVVSSVSSETRPWDLFEAAIERSPLPLVHTQGDGHIVRYANRAFCDLCEMDRALLIGRPLSECLPGGDDGYSLVLDRVVQFGGLQSAEDLKHLDPAGEAVYRSYVVWPTEVHETGIPGLVIQVTDTTARAVDAFNSSRLAGDLRDVNAALVTSGIERDKAAERAEAAERTSRNHQAEIESLNRRLQRAMTETHHRVKNNLQIIVGLIDLRVMDNAVAVPVDEVRQIGMSARTLAALHDVLTADSKTEGEGDSISVYALLDKVLTMLQRVAAPKRIRTALADFQVPPRSGAALALVVNELVNNALKHGKGEVSVTLTLSGDMAALEVTDNGPGFSADFDRLVRASTGLELVENLVTRDLGGRAAFDNHPDGGCRVIIRFPIAESAESPVNAPPV